MTLSTGTVLAAIGGGDLDTDLINIISAAQQRLSQVRSTKTVKDFGIGDAVKFNDTCGTRYLVGHTGRIVGMKRTKLVVTLDVPTGRFARVNPITRQVESAHITVPIAIVDPL